MTHWTRAKDMMLIVLLWLLTIVVVNPAGNFPLVDDWAFGRSVRHLLQTGQYDSLGWGYMTLVTNVLWGALFCLPDGFSYTSLRLSTLLASLGCLIGTYVLMRNWQQPRWFALLVVLVLGFNPVYLAMSFSFMTDVPFTALCVWTSVFFIQALQTSSGPRTRLATALAIVTTLSRQLALAIPLAFAVAEVFKSRLTVRVALRALLPALACFGAYLLAYQSGVIGIKVDKLILNSLPDLQRLYKILIHNTYSTLIHLGLFLLPVTLLVAGRLRHAPRVRVLVGVGIGAAIVILLLGARMYYGDEILLPLFHNILVNSGVGPTIIRDVFLLKLDNMRALPAGFWMTVSAMGIGGAILLIAVLTLPIWELLSRLRTGERRSEDAIRIFALVTIALYFLLLMPAPLYFDRYVIPMMPFIVVAMVRPATNPTENSERFSIGSIPALRAAAFTLVAAFAVFAVAGTRDYLMWNRLRWTALDELMRDGVSPTEIDGGFEFNGFYVYQPPFVRPRPDSSISPWWVRRDTYQIAFGPVPGYTVVRKYTYQHWLPWHVQTVVILRKQ